MWKKNNAVFQSAPAIIGSHKLYVKLYPFFYDTILKIVKID